ncbi:MAG: PIN domain-containing protein [Candidatus Riflebacteria bacterium]|nr:PIN domain-containing protein [Candidatus Riflebacteria bacterium]
MSEHPIVHLDSCLFIALFKAEVGRAQICRAIIEDASTGKIHAGISTLAIAETRRPLGLEKDVSELLLQPFFRKSSLDLKIAKLARDLLEKIPGLKGADAVHLATAMDAGAKWLMTYDTQLLKCNRNPFVGKIEITEPSRPWDSQLILPL